MRRVIRAFRPSVDHTWTVRTPKGPVQARAVDLLRCDAETHAEARAALVAIQRATMERATHGRTPDIDFETATTIYTDRALDPTVDWHFNTLITFHADGALVGVSQGRAHFAVLDSGPVEVLVATAFAIRAWQGAGLPKAGVFAICARYAPAHLLTRRPRYYAAVSMNPVTYRQICRGATAVYPSDAFDAPAQMRALYATLFDDLTDEDGLVVEPRRSRLEPRTIEWLARTDDPMVREYVRRNPHYAEGYGLPVLVRLRVSDFMRATAQTAWAKARSVWRRAR